MLPNNNTAASIPANKSATLYLFSVVDRYTCVAVVTFNPEANQTYTVNVGGNVYGLVESFTKSSAGQCSYSILNARTHQAVRFAIREYNREWLSDGKCSDAMSQGGSGLSEVNTVTVPMKLHQ